MEVLQVLQAGHDVGIAPAAFFLVGSAQRRVKPGSMCKDSIFSVVVLNLLDARTEVC